VTLSYTCLGRPNLGVGECGCSPGDCMIVRVACAICAEQTPLGGSGSPFLVQGKVYLLVQERCRYLLKARSTHRENQIQRGGDKTRRVGQARQRLGQSRLTHEETTRRTRQKNKYRDTEVAFRILLGREGDIEGRTLNHSS